MILFIKDQAHGFDNRQNCCSTATITPSKCFFLVRWRYFFENESYFRATLSSSSPFQLLIGFSSVVADVAAEIFQIGMGLVMLSKFGHVSGGENTAHFKAFA